MASASPAPGSAGPADRGAGCGAAGTGGRRTPARGPGAPGGPAAPCRRASRRAGTARRRPARSAYRWRPAGVVGDPGRAFHMVVIRLARSRHSMPAAAAARARSPAKYPASARSAIFRPAAAAPSRIACGRRPAPAPATPPRWSGVIIAGQQASASGISVSAQAATCGRPARCPVGVRHPAFPAPVHLHVGGVDVDGHRPFRQLRGALGGSRPAIFAVACASPASAPRQCRAVSRRASPVAVEVARPGTGVTCGRPRRRAAGPARPGSLRRP